MKENALDNTLYLKTNTYTQTQNWAELIKLALNDNNENEKYNNVI
jgi:hypothetical protein